MITCRKCFTTRPESEFYIVRKTGKPRSWCKSCVKANVIEWQRANKERHRAKQRRSDLKRWYGLSEADVAALAEAQGGACAICREPSANLVVDHCHTTSRVRGLLCSVCNGALGMLQDDLNILKSAAAYLDR